jgi:hypothetical protein
MRNYRIIAKQNNMGAWGSGRSQVKSPVKDSIRFKLIGEKFNLFDNVYFLDDSLTFAHFPETTPIVLIEPVYFLTDSITFDIEDD